MASNKYMTVDQLAERWMCSPSYVRTLLRSGQLSAVKIAGWKVRQDISIHAPVKGATAKITKTIPNDFYKINNYNNSFA